MKIVSWDKEHIDDAIALWNKEIGKQFPLRKDLFIQNSLEDENVCFDGSSMAFDDNESVIGFIIVKKWKESLNVPMNPEVGWVQVLIVDSKHRNQGIGTKLLEKAENHLKKSGIKTLHLGRDPWHYFPGIPNDYEQVKQWFERRGYLFKGHEYDLICQYSNHTLDPLPDDKAVSFSILSLEEKEDFLEFLHRCFPGRWEYEAIHYFKKGGLGREFVVAKKNERIIGFCRINDEKSPFIAQNVYWSPLFEEELGGIGPLGIDQNERKNGYGLAIVKAAVHFLRQRAVKQIVIDWTGLVEFYGKLGYKPWKSYAQYAKSL
ncbi:MAG TPA: GNAT family N-acetyltransferase [Bacillus sp. (in: firmicutes)]|uniref:GNAT family N-acetyltransferase n=1 Tax=Bacillus litorisediminis TaxID=2922713 RepID=UPI001FAFBAD2|nr:GNAT family N-acetyltransferase [Bacillus litorisediminis]HWO75015.1 GNAT family N-acetyltransferase [Bacillus sp. (in: firmicutes)]